jgi:hypothetical protein
MCFCYRQKIEKGANMVNRIYNRFFIKEIPSIIPSMIPITSNNLIKNFSKSNYFKSNYSIKPVMALKPKVIFW